MTILLMEQELGDLVQLVNKKMDNLGKKVLTFGKICVIIEM